MSSDDTHAGSRSLVAARLIVSHLPRVVRQSSREAIDIGCASFSCIIFKFIPMASQWPPLVPPNDDRFPVTVSDRNGRTFSLVRAPTTTSDSSRETAPAGKQHLRKSRDVHKQPNVRVKSARVRVRHSSPVKMVPVLIAMVMRTFFVSGQNCFGGIETFEKLAMTDFDENYTPAGILLQQIDQALTRDCINLCKQQPTCLSFGLDYMRFRCAAYAVNSYGRGGDLVTSNSTNYFEKVCYRGVSRDEYERVCGVERLWAFERVRGAFLDGFERAQLTNVGSRSECAKACLMETSFICRSADYDELLRVCRLSKEDRRTQPQAFRVMPNSHREYLENQCAAPGELTTILFQIN